MCKIAAPLACELKEKRDQIRDSLAENYVYTLYLYTIDVSFTRHIPTVALARVP